MKNILFFILFFYFLIIFQNSFLVHFTVAGIVPNLILISVIIFNFFEKPRKNTGFVMAAIGGFYLDLYSGFPIGVFIFSLCLLAFLIKKIFKFIGEENIIYFIFLLFLSLVFYDLFSFASSFLLQQSFYFNFNLLRLAELAYNLFLGILAFCFVKLCILKRLKK